MIRHMLYKALVLSKNKTYSPLQLTENIKVLRYIFRQIYCQIKMVCKLQRVMEKRIQQISMICYMIYV